MAMPEYYWYLSLNVIKPGVIMHKMVAAVIENKNIKFLFTLVHRQQSVAIQVA